MLNLDKLKWIEIEDTSRSLKEIKPLFERIDTARIEEELKLLKGDFINQSACILFRIKRFSERHFTLGPFR